MGLSKVEKINLKQIFKLCNKIRVNDFDMKTLLNHEIFIRGNSAKYVIEYYSLYGSQYINNYLRKLVSSYKSSINVVYDVFIENMISILWNFTINAPALTNDHYVYRFIDNDKYLENLKIGELYTDYSFTSTSRNPFYSPKNNYFGNILIKIKLPKNNKGICICLESYSLFYFEYEVLLPPAKFKLIAKDDNFKYYHPNKEAQNKIKKKYEFELLNHLENEPLKIIKNKKINIKIPQLNIEKFDKYNKTYFYEEYLSNFNGMKPLEIMYNFNNIEKKLLLHCYYYKKSSIYNNFFYNQDDFPYFVQHAKNTCRFN